MKGRHMLIPAAVTVSLAVLALVALAGCGGGSGGDTTTTATAVKSATDSVKATSSSETTAGARVSGVVKSLTADSSGALASFVLAPQQGRKGRGSAPAAPAELTISVTASTTYLSGKTTVTSTAVAAGVAVDVVLDGQLSNNAGTATQVSVRQPRVSGTITALNTDEAGVLGSLVLTMDQAPGAGGTASEATLTVTSSTAYYSGKTALTANDLSVGMHVDVLLTAALSNSTGTAVEVDIVLPMVRGTITSVTTDSGALQSFVLKTVGRDSATVTISVTSSTVYMIDPDTTGSGTDLTKGMKVDVLLAAALADKAGTAVEVRVMPSMVKGTVNSLTSDTSGALQSFVLTTKGMGDESGVSVTIAVTSSTRYMTGPNTAGTSASVTTGANVDVVLKSALVDNAGTAVEVRVMPAASGRT